MRISDWSSDVCSSDLGKGTFYLYFGGKQQIFDELVMDLNRRVRRAMSEHADTATTRAERERRGYLGYFRFASEHPAMYRVRKSVVYGHSVTVSVDLCGRRIIHKKKHKHIIFYK